MPMTGRSQLAGPLSLDRWCRRHNTAPMSSTIWGREIAEIYDKTYAAQFDRSVMEPTLDLLSDLAQGGQALEFAVGTGRVALPLSDREVAVQGIELSPHMVEQLQAKPGADAVTVAIGDMTTTRVPGAFQLVYLVTAAGRDLLGSCQHCATEAI